MSFNIAISDGIQHEKSLDGEKLQIICPFDEMGLCADDPGGFGIFFDEVHTDLPAGKPADEIDVYNGHFPGIKDDIHNIGNGADVSVEDIDDLTVALDGF